MRTLFTRRKAVLLCVLLILSTLPTFAGHYRLVYWRERGLYENSGCGGHFVINVFVWDKNGFRLENKAIHTTWGVLQARTNYEGYAQFLIDPDADRDLVIVDPPHTSDATPLFSVAHQPCYGHYSYEAGFMLVDGPGDLTIDQTTCGTLNTRGSVSSDAPHTRSLIFHSIDCLDRASDPFNYGTWSNSFAQTFLVPQGVNRLLGIQFHMTLGGGKVAYAIEVREDSPTGRIVYSTQTPYAYNDGPWLTYFGLDACPVEPGRTYAVRLWRNGGMNAYHVTRNVYPQGSYYANDVANPNLELRGFVIGGTRGSAVTPTPTATRSPTPMPTSSTPSLLQVR